MNKPSSTALLAALLSISAVVAASPTVTPPPSIVADQVPPIPEATAAATRRYLEFRTAKFLGWNAADHSVLAKTRFGSTEQLIRVSAPGSARRQISFEAEPVPYASLSSKDGTVVVQKDQGGDEFYQLYRLDAGQLTLLTDGKARNWFGAWSRDGKSVGYASSRRNGADMDLYMVDPRDPSSDRLIAQVNGGGWNVSDFSPDGDKALAVNRMSITHSIVAEIDLKSGKLRTIAGEKENVSYTDAHYAADGKSIWTISNKGSDFQRLGKLDRSSGKFTPVIAAAKWDVSNVAFAADESFIAYATNEAGVSRLYVYDTASGASRRVDGLPAGVLDWSFGKLLQVAPWGEIGLSMSAARVPGDVFTVDAETLAVKRWTYSEAGGLDVAKNREPELVAIKSFDGEAMSGFLYRPDPQRFPGKRPLVVDIHGGPEGQSRPNYLGEDNYLVNELGIALFYPNVRGSDGYGARFLGLDNGPWKREDTVKDIGVFLDTLAADSALDSSRFAVYGFSYGGYMCYASATHFSAKLRSASCAVAISDFVTFLTNTQKYRQDLRRVEYGDERDPKQRAKLVEISPMHNVGNIRIPMMVAAGGNDPRVPASEAKQMVDALRKQGNEAWHVLAKNEGHGFHKRENSDFIFWTRVEFWKKTLLSQP